MTLSIEGIFTEEMKSELEKRAKAFAKRHNIKKIPDSSWVETVECEIGYEEYEGHEKYLGPLWRRVCIRVTGYPDRVGGYVGTFVD